MSTASRVERLLVALAVALAVTVVGWLVFVRYPDELVDLLGVVIVAGLALAGLRLGGRVAGSLAAEYNVAEVAVEGPISRDGGRPSPTTAGGTPADDIVDQIERADEDGNVEALLVKLNTPGGEIVPSEDIRIAAERFDGPTVGYATDVCASGGYDIASGCDELWAREGSLVGSIGVVGSRVNAADLADRVGLDYEQLTAGEYKDAGTPLKEVEPEEREYLQGLVDDYYDQFVETVAEGRDVDRETVEDTEARVYLGSEAHEMGLVDDLGDRRAVEQRLESLVGEAVSVEQFQPQRPLRERIRVGAERTAYAVGAGVAGAVEGDIDGLRFRR